MRITGNYRCRPGVPGRLLVAFVPLAAGPGGRDGGGRSIVGGEVGQIDADGSTHTFVIDLGLAVDAEADPQEFRHGEAARVVAKLYFDEFAAQLDWECFVTDSAAARGPRWPRRQLLLAAVREIVVVD
ncbi:hypothetical protein [Nocardia yunnanensis]|nr:hypothetical protein [Nocardia yunnanensis]